MKTNYKAFAFILTIALAASLAGCADNPAASSAEATTGQSDTAPVKDTAQTDDDGDEAWKNNLGTITLGNTITCQGEGISVEGSTVTITAGGDYAVTGTLADGQILVNSSEKVKLRLNSVDITCSTGPAIFFNDAKKAFITLEENTTNILTDGGSYTVDAKAPLFSNDTLEIKGNGTLIVNGNYKHGIASDDDIIIENGTIQITSVTDGLHANDNITVTGGNLTINSGSDGIESEGDIIIDAGTFSIAAADDGIHAETDLAVNGGTIDVTKSFEGLESKAVMTINGGNIKIKADDDGLNAGTQLIVNDGSVYIDCEGDGLDSNGDMTINGGDMEVYSGNNGNGAIDVGDRGVSLIVNGGTVMATGGRMGIAVSESSTQYSLWIGANTAANAKISITDAGGAELDSFTPVKSSSLIYYSSGKLAAGETYTATADGSSLGSAAMSAKSAVIGNMSGGMGGKPGGMRGDRPVGEPGDRPVGGPGGERGAIQ